MLSAHRGSSSAQQPPQVPAQVRLLALKLLLLLLLLSAGPAQL
jgi:hypothetical protein